MEDHFVDFREANDLEDLAIHLTTSIGLLKAKIDEDNPKRSKLKPQINEDNHADSKPIKKGYISELQVIKVDSPDNIFCKFEIPKKNKNRIKKNRVVWAIMDHEYEELYKKLNSRLNLFAQKVIHGYPQPAAYGFMKGRNILENAQQHCKKQLILHADIRDFFPSITINCIEDMFHNIGIKQNIAGYLSKILTIENTLPLGLHTSPLISNLICLQLDSDFTELASKYACEYTRYADDITISGIKLPDSEEVEHILTHHNFTLANDKFKITKPGWHHVVTGLSVETDTPRIPKFMKKRLRQELHYCNKYGVKNHVEKVMHRKANNEEYQKHINRIDGTVKYISFFEKKFNTTVKDLWCNIRTKDKISANYQDRRTTDISLYIDETEIDYKEEKYLVVAIVSILCTDKEKFKNVLSQLRKEYIQNPFASIKKEDLKKNGLHFADATEDLRKEMLDKISQKHFKVFIGYKKLKNNNDYMLAYIDVLKSLLNYRFLNNKEKIIKIVIEKNQDKVPGNRIIKMIQDVKEVRKNCAEVELANKQHILLSIADIALGFFRQYVISKNKTKNHDQTDRYILFFEQLRSKYKSIKNFDTRKVYSRKNHFNGEL